MNLQDLAQILSNQGQYANGLLGGANYNQAAAGGVGGGAASPAYPGANLPGNAGVAARAGYYGGQVEGAKTRSEIEYQQNVGRSFLMRAQNEAIMHDDDFIRDPARGWWLGYKNPEALRGIIRAANQRRVAAGLDPYDEDAVIKAYSEKPPTADSTTAPTPAGGFPESPKPSDTPDVSQFVHPPTQSGGTLPKTALPPAAPVTVPNIASPMAFNPVPGGSSDSLMALASLLQLGRGGNNLPMGDSGVGSKAGQKVRRPWGNYREYFIRKEAGKGDAPTTPPTAQGAPPAPPANSAPLPGGATLPPSQNPNAPLQNWSLDIPGVGQMTLPQTAQVLLGRNAQNEYQGWVNKGAPEDLANTLTQQHTQTLQGAAAAEMQAAGFPLAVIAQLTGLDLTKAQTGETKALGEAATSQASTAAGNATTARLGSVISGYNSIVNNDLQLLEQQTISRTGNQHDYNQAVKEGRVTTDFRGKAFDTLTMGENVGTGALPGANETGSNVLGGSLEQGRSTAQGAVGTQGTGSGQQRTWREYKNPALASQILLDIQNARDAQKTALQGTTTNFEFNQSDRQIIDGPTTPHDINIAASLANGTYKDPNTGRTLNYSQYIDALRKQGNSVGVARAEKVHNDWLMQHHEKLQTTQPNPYAAKPQPTPAQPETDISTPYRTERGVVPANSAQPPSATPGNPTDPFQGANGWEEFWWRATHPGGSLPPPGYFSKKATTPQPSNQPPITGTPMNTAPPGVTRMQ